MSMGALTALLYLLLGVLALAVVALVSLLVTVAVQAYSDRRLERALLASQVAGRTLPDSAPTAPVGLQGRMEAWTTGSIPTVGELRRLAQEQHDTPGASNNPGDSHDTGSILLR